MGGLINDGTTTFKLIGPLPNCCLAWYVMSGWIHGLAGAATLLIALLTVGFYSVRAALANPVKRLRKE
jgi:hypothetical protein